MEQVLLKEAEESDGFRHPHAAQTMELTISQHSTISIIFFKMSFTVGITLQTRNAADE